MKIIKLRKNDKDPTDDAIQIAEIFENKFGISLYNRDAKNPNDVHGYLNTASDGSVEVHLYEQEDAEKENPKAVANLKTAIAIKSVEKNGRLELATLKEEFGAALERYDDKYFQTKLDEILSENPDLELISFFDTTP